MNLLRIAIDGRNLLAAEGTGIATYANALVRALKANGAATEMLVAGDGARRGRVRRYAAALAARFGGVSSTFAPSLHPSIERLRVAPDAFRCAQVYFDIWRRLLPVTGPDMPSVMHWTAPLPLRLIGARNIYTFHDVIPLRHPNRTDTDAGRYRRLLRGIAASADHVLTVSEASRRDILGALPELAGRISVIPQVVEPPGPALALSAAAVDAAARHELGCGIGEFYLFCGTIEPRKNLPALINAFHASASARRLVLAGPDGWRAGEELRGLIGGPVVRVGYLHRGTLMALMRGARAMLYPSLDEGFGLPIIEAMGVGTPVLTAAGGATAEVAGDAALLVDAADPAALAAAIRRIDRDDELAADLQRRGRRRAADFAPDVYAARLAALHRAVADAPRFRD